VFAPLALRHVVDAAAAAAAAAAATAAASPAAPTAAVAAPAEEEVLSLHEWDVRLAATAADDGIVILDALAASGLRPVRYWKEIAGIRKIIVNDLDPVAVEAAKRNIAHNDIDASRVLPQQGDATMVMYANRNAPPGDQYDVIDLDPYGSASPFLDAAVQAIADGGLLCVTCTDMAVLSGSHPETCYAKYGAMPTKGKYLHEMALRIVLSSLESHANRYRRHIVPVLSLGIDFYVRLFVRVFVSPAEVKNSCLKLAYVHQSLHCPSFHMQPVAKHTGNTYQPGLGPTGGGFCAETGSQFKVGGPIWSAPIHDPSWVAEALERVERRHNPHIDTQPRLHGLLTSVSEELLDVPLYYTLPDLCQTLHCTSPKMSDVQAALVNAGYRVSNQHKEPTAIKTDAPNDVVWDILRCWVKKHPIASKRVSTTSPGHRILATEPTLVADFDGAHRFRPAAKKPACRYPPNPEPMWGPKSRAKSHGPNKRARVEDPQPPNDGGGVAGRGGLSS
jgi:tRNA (guanine26-N2/guanine27-N2)-dimethyltransferase